MVVVYPNKKIQIEINEIVVFNESFAREVFIIRRVETFDEASNFLFEGEAEAAQWSKGRSIRMFNIIPLKDMANLFYVCL